MHYLSKSRTHTVNDSIWDFDWVCMEIVVINCIVGMLLTRPIVISWKLITPKLSAYISITLWQSGTTAPHQSILLGVFGKSLGWRFCWAGITSDTLLIPKSLDGFTLSTWIYLGLTLRCFAYLCGIRGFFWKILRVRRLTTYSLRHLNQTASNPGFYS